MGINIRRTYNNKASQATLQEKFIAGQKNDKSPFIIQVASHLIVLKVKEEDSHWWSPEVNLRIDSEQDETMISEVIGPNSSIFTLAMFCIWIGAIALMASAMMALAQIQIGNPAGLAIPAAIFSGLLIVVTLSVLAMGRLKAAGQVSRLRQFIQDIISA